MPLDLILFPSNPSFFDERYVELRRRESFPAPQLLWISMDSNSCGPWWGICLAPGFVPLPFLFLHLQNCKEQFCPILSARESACGGVLSVLPLLLFDTELCSCMFLCPKRRSTFPAARNSPELKGESHLLSCLCAGISRRQDRNRGIPLPKGTPRE